MPPVPALLKSKGTGKRQPAANQAAGDGQGGADEADAGAATREAYNHFADDALDYGTGLLLPARYASDAEHSEAARNAEGDA